MIWVGGPRILNESKIQISVRPKPGFGIGNWNPGPILVLVSEAKFFFKLHIFLIFSHFLVEGYTLKLENKCRSLKMI